MPVINLRKFNVNRTQYRFIQYISSLFCILNGCSQIDYIGQEMFPRVNRFYVKNYYRYLNLISWKIFCLNPSAVQFRAVIGHVTLISGILLLFNIRVRDSCKVMCIIGTWSTYAHIRAKDPLYMAIITGLFSLHVFTLVVVHIAFWERAENFRNVACNYIQYISGVYFVVQGCAQVDYMGKRHFPNVNKVITSNYYNYVKSIPWNSIGFIAPSANIFREVVGYSTIISGILLLANNRVKQTCTLMCIIAAWSVYAHNRARDPMYMTILDGWICVLMFALASN